MRLLIAILFIPMLASGQSLGGGTSAPSLGAGSNRIELQGIGTRQILPDSSPNDLLIPPARGETLPSRIDDLRPKNLGATMPVDGSQTTQPQGLYVDPFQRRLPEDQRLGPPPTVSSIPFGTSAGLSEEARRAIDLHRSGAIGFDALVQRLPENALAADVLKRLNDPMVFLFQTVGGTPIGGQPQSGVCTGPTCGTAADIPATASKPPICPKHLCPDSPSVSGCFGPEGRRYCGYPKRQSLPHAAIGIGTGVTFIKSGYPELVVFGIVNENLQTFGPGCTAVMVAARWALAALHCIIPDTIPAKIGDKYPFFWSYDHVGTKTKVPGWTKLTQKPEYRDRFLWFLARHDGKLAQLSTVSAAYIPYARNEAVRVATGGVPAKDLVLLELDRDIGVSGPDLPSIDRTGYALADRPLSFAGFGVADPGTTPPPIHDGGPIDAVAWRERLSVAFNFIFGTDASATHIHWQQDRARGWGGPCSVDSGSAIYEGFNRGFWDDPRKLIGITSAILNSTISSGELLDADDCTSPASRGRGVALARHAAAICSLTDEAVKGCN